MAPARRPLPAAAWGLGLFDRHVEVVTTYAGGVLDTIGGDSLPNFSVNAHQYDGSLAADSSLAGFVNNGDLDSAASQAPARHRREHIGTGHGHRGQPGVRQRAWSRSARVKGQASVPGLVTPFAESRQQWGRPPERRRGCSRVPRRLRGSIGEAPTWRCCGR